MSSCRQPSFNRRDFLSVAAAGYLVSTARAQARQESHWNPGWVSEVAGLEQPGITWTVAFSQDGLSMAAGGWNKGDYRPPGWITVWDTATWKPVRSFRIDDCRIQRLGFLPAHKTLVVAGWEETRLFAIDLDSSAIHDIERTPGTNGMRMSFVADREGRFLFTSCEPEGLKVWKTSSWRLDHHVVGTRDHCLLLAADPTSIWPHNNIYFGGIYAVDSYGVLFQLSPRSPPPETLLADAMFQHLGIFREPGVSRPWRASHLTISSDGNSSAIAVSEESNERIDVYTLGSNREWRRRFSVELGRTDSQYVRNPQFRS